MPRHPKRSLCLIAFLAIASTVALVATVRRVRSCPRAFVGEALRGHRFPIHTLAFSPDGSRLTSAAYYLSASRVELAQWDVVTSRRLSERSAPCNGIRTLAIDLDRRTLAVAEDQTVCLWDQDALDKRRQFTERPPIASVVAFSRCGHFLALADAADVTVWNVVDGHRQVRAQGTTTRAVALTFAPDGKTLAGTQDTTVCLWDPHTRQLRGICRGHANPLTAVAFSPSGSSLASGDIAGHIRLWDVTSLTDQGARAMPCQPSSRETVHEEVSALVFSPDGRTLAAAVGPVVLLWEVASGRLLSRLEGHSAKILCLAYTTDGTLLASAGHDRTIRLWDVGQHRPR